MEKEKRLIDAKDFDLRVSQKKMSEVFPNWKELPKEVQDAVCKHGEYIHMLLETQLTVDAVEVVRCKDCKYQCTESCPTYYEDRMTYRDSWSLDGDNDFCSYGERKDNDRKTD